MVHVVNIETTLLNTTVLKLASHSHFHISTVTKSEVLLLITQTPINNWPYHEKTVMCMSV